MNTATTLSLVAILILAIAGVIAAVAVYRKRQSARLRQQFGPEYARAVEQHGGQSKAEVALLKREARVAKLTIRPLSADQASKFSQAWKRVQSLFVDNPRGAVAAADKLVQEVMSARGYPTGDFEVRAADVSVDHPTVVENYRAAQLIAAKDARGAADTEELRKAFVHYRTLFSELLEVQPDAVVAIPRQSIGAQR